MLKRFLRDTRGNIAMMFGLMTIPLIAATGAALDYSRAYEQRQVVQDALDAAALAANRLIGLATEEQIYAEALAFFLANTEGRIQEGITLNMVVDGGSVRLTTQLPVSTYFLGIVGVDTINFDVMSLSIAGAATYEVVLVLDNSTSMQGTKITTLRTAARDLINSLFALSLSNPSPDPIRIGLVPFAASVNIGPSNRNSGWMDTTGISPNSRLNFTTNAEQASWFASQYPGVTMPANTFGTYTNTFALFDALGPTTGSNRFIGWGGCVEARAYPYQVNDTAPDPNTPATLFTPMFAPDEPGNAGSPKSGFSHSYLNDTGGQCVNSTTVTTTDRRGRTTTTTVEFSFTNLQLQERTCKYRATSGTLSLGTSYRGMGQGPNLNCTTTAITPLSDNQAALISAVNAMQAPSSPIGYTNILEGIMWGWRVLSDTEPFTQGRPYGEVGNHKVMIIMTDGANTYNQPNSSNMNRSEYMAFNYIVHNYLGTTSSNNNTVVNQMNTRTLEACANLRQTNITVYTIAFQIPANQSSALTIMQQCASDANKVFDAQDNAQLIAAFQLIAQDIATLRIAE